MAIFQLALSSSWKFSSGALLSNFFVTFSEIWSFSGRTFLLQKNLRKISVPNDQFSPHNSSALRFLSRKTKKTLDFDHFSSCTFLLLKIFIRHPEVNFFCGFQVFGRFRASGPPKPIGKSTISVPKHPFSLRNSSALRFLSRKTKKYPDFGRFSSCTFLLLKIFITRVPCIKDCIKACLKACIKACIRKEGKYFILPPWPWPKTGSLRNTVVPGSWFPAGVQLPRPTVFLYEPVFGQGHGGSMKYFPSFLIQAFI